MLQQQSKNSDYSDPLPQLLDWHCKGLVEFSPIATPWPVSEDNRSPHALARFEAIRGDSATTPFHTPYPLGELEHEMIRLFSQHTDPDLVIDALLDKVEVGKITLEKNTSERCLQTTREKLEASVASMRQWGLF